MIVLASAANLIVGVALLTRTPRDPARRALNETLAGLALIAGLLLIGFGLAGAQAR